MAHHCPRCGKLILVSYINSPCPFCNGVGKKKDLKEIFKVKSEKNSETVVN